MHGTTVRQKAQVRQNFATPTRLLTSNTTADTEGRGKIYRDFANAAEENS